MPSRPDQGQDPEPTVAVELTGDAALSVLSESDVVGGQRIPWSSNYTFLVRLDAGPGKHLRAVYKPRDGEQPLYDFPDGSLYKREYAAYLLSRALGWPDVPPTIIREGPYGVGAMQLFIETDYNITYFDLIGDHLEPLRKFAVFDLLANNADRKGGHCLLDNGGKVWSIDHGLTFHPLFKLRTVMLDFWGTEIPRDLVSDLDGLAGRLGAKGDLGDALAELLDEKEIAMLLRRLDGILGAPVIPRLSPRHNVPWPLE
jgi:hypothetical protein